ncbi:hypothetical protein [Isachenkonia alkalipeptolytica]|uniref:Uncharacterized protein n=1 Tax=Isachenkonia alkalipeptolytica TaxID=2565777 RepID=A0AA43XJQ2_9CLOT|nr:hypothetical protein [Isachenkonia alkalipeptolytica]NBG87877.1 hypothetical protein [Isachenkonia alkalipeptolytica]
MKRNKAMYGMARILVLALTFLLVSTVLNSEYLFQWVAHNRMFYLVLCVIPFVLFLLNKILLSRFITVGIVAGIFIGNYFGGWIKTYNESRIVDNMSAEEIARLQHHPGFEIWMGAVLFTAVIGMIIHRVLGKN